MRRSFKIALSAVLTYLVFGLFNWFGQPQRFVPPLFFDAVFLPLFGMYLIYISAGNRQRFPLIALSLSLALTGYNELRDIGPDTRTIALFSIVLLIFAVIGHLTSFIRKFLHTDRTLGINWMVFVLLLVASCIFLLAGLFTGKQADLIAYAYWICGAAGLILTWNQQDKSDLADGDFGFVLLISLSALFDFMTYSALNLLR